mgnify:CR=1 FL=1
MDNLEQEWNRCMLTGLVHALYRSGMLTQEQQLHLLCELKQTPVKYRTALRAICRNCPMAAICSKTW